MLLAWARSMKVFTAMVSPGVRRAKPTRCRRISSRLIFQKLELGVVSGLAVSLSSTRSEASRNSAVLTRTCSWLRSMPWALSRSSPTCPAILTLLMKWVVLTFIWRSDNSSTITCLCSNGHNCTEATMRCMSATVSLTPLSESLGSSTFTSSNERSRGKAKRT